LHLRNFKARFSVKSELVFRYRDGGFEGGDPKYRNDSEAIKTIPEQLTELLRQNPGISTRDFGDLGSRHRLGRDRAQKFLAAGQKNRTIHIKKGSGMKRLHFLVVDGSTQSEFPDAD
jgi:hypothetical protein